MVLIVTDRPLAFGLFYYLYCNTCQFVICPTLTCEVHFHLSSHIRSTVHFSGFLFLYFSVHQPVWIHNTPVQSHLLAFQSRELRLNSNTLAQPPPQQSARPAWELTAQPDVMDLESPFTSSGETSLSDGDESPDRVSTDELRPGTHPIGISRNYVPGWTCADAFREFYQNWSGFNLTPPAVMRDF